MTLEEIRYLAEKHAQEDMEYEKHYSRNPLDDILAEDDDDDDWTDGE